VLVSATLRRQRAAAWLAGAALLLPPLSLAPYAKSGTELARVRNALVFDQSPQPAFEWTPANMPRDFLRDTSAPDPSFVRIAMELRLAEQPDDWARALVISRHLLGSAPRLNGGAIQADLDVTYRRITVHGDGYCADFVRVFQAIAGAAGMPMRAWAFSFDGYGGHGHVFPEIWNRERRTWQFVDLFNNVYVTHGVGDQPLSALALRDALQAGDASLRSVPLHPSARPGFVHEAKLWDYYRRGLPEWYLWWGNNPFDYERSIAVRSLAPVSRSLAQLGAIVQGVQPHAQALATAQNGSQRRAMERLRAHVIIAALFFCAGLALLVLVLARRRSGSTTSQGHGTVHAHGG
jgi:hypothetical protein